MSTPLRWDLAPVGRVKRLRITQEVYAAGVKRWRQITLRSQSFHSEIHVVIGITASTVLRFNGLRELKRLRDGLTEIIDEIEKEKTHGTAK